MVEEIARGGLGVADVGEGPGDDDPIEAGQDAGDLLGMSFDEVGHGQPGVGGWAIHVSPERKIDGAEEQSLFGSGYAGLVP